MLSRDKVLVAAVTLLDEQGLAGLSLRALARRLGVAPMSLYNHVASKEDLLDAAVRAYLASARTKRPGMRSSTTKDVRLTFWLGASIAEQIDSIAMELGVSAARVLDAAIRYFTAERVTPTAREFRKETEDRAARFVERMLNRG